MGTENNWITGVTELVVIVIMGCGPKDGCEQLSPNQTSTIFPPSPLPYSPSTPVTNGCRTESRLFSKPTVRKGDGLDQTANGTHNGQSMSGKTHGDREPALPRFLAGCEPWNDQQDRRFAHKGGLWLYTP